MIGSIIRLVVFFGAVAVGTYTVAVLLETEGGVTISVAGYDYTLTPLAAVAALLVASAGMLVLVRVVDITVALVLFILGDPAAVRRFTDATRRRRGLETLDATLMALATGDAAAAQANAKKAERLLRRPGLTRLLMAQTAEAAGDMKRARRYWRALSEEPETALVGLKGLLRQAQAAGETDRARALAERAAEIAPQDAQVLDTLYALQNESYDWAGARQTLARQRKIGAVPRAEADRRGAALALALAEDADAARDRDAAKRYAVEAAKLDPANPEAAVAAARHLAADGQKRPAGRHLIEAWTRSPSPEIARAFAEIEDTESADARRKRFEKLFAANPEHRETAFVRAELALAARDWQGARAAIAPLGRPEDSARACAIMAAIARGEGDAEAVVRAWLARALGAPRDDRGDGDRAQASMLPLLVGEATVEAATSARDAPAAGLEAPSRATATATATAPTTATPTASPAASDAGASGTRASRTGEQTPLRPESRTESRPESSTESRTGQDPTPPDEATGGDLGTPGRPRTPSA